MALMPRRKIVGVIGSHSEPWEEYAAPLGVWIAQRGFHLLTGGGGGVMLSVSRAFCSVAGREGLVLGVVPMDGAGDVVKEGYPNEYVDVAILSPLGTFTGEDPDQVSRNHINVMTSDVLVILPGAVGTLNEANLAVKFSKPAVLFGPPECFAGFQVELPRRQNLEVVAKFVDCA